MADVTSEDNARIAVLTADAIRASGDRMLADIHAVVEKSNEMAEGIRRMAAKFEQDISERTLEVTDLISTYVTFCGKTTDLFKELQTSPPLINGSASSKQQWDNEISKIRAMLPSDIDGR